MPIYEYRCRDCGHQDSDLESIKAPRLKKCPECGKRAFERLVSASAFHLKGGGWYETDFKNKPKPPADKGEKPADKDGKGEGKKGEKTSDADKGASDSSSSSKPAKSGESSPSKSKGDSK